MLYLVRHGRTASNAARLLLGRMDVPLDELGRRQAAALAEVPQLRGATRVISSPLARAYDTASAIGPPVTVDDRWIEIDYGRFDGLELSAATQLWAAWDADLEYRPEGGESLSDLGRRVRAACADLWEEASGSDVVVVSHVSPIKAAVAWALGPLGAVYLVYAYFCRVGSPLLGSNRHRRGGAGDWIGPVRRTVHHAGG